MYEMRERIRFSETDESGRLSMKALVRLFQDCGYFHALERDQGRKPDDSFTWYLIRWHIESYEMPPCGTRVTVGTWIYSNAASVARKQLVLKDSENGKVYAMGDTMWAYVNIKTGKASIPDVSIWEKSDFGEKQPLLHQNKRILRCKAASKLPETVVDSRLLDINHHANNVLFTEFAMDAADAKDCTFLSAEFLNQARAGETLHPYLSFDDKGKTVSVLNNEGTPYAMFRFE